MKKLSIFAAIAIATLTFITHNSAHAESYKSDAMIVDHVNDIMVQMSSKQQQMLLQQAEIIEEKLRNMSERERDELKNSVRDISQSINFETINVKSLQKITPKSFGATLNDMKHYQRHF